jgi:hypothetical protein
MEATMSMYATIFCLHMMISGDVYAHVKAMFVAVGLTLSGRRKKRGQGRCFYSFGSFLLALVSFAQVLFCAAI